MQPPGKATMEGSISGFTLMEPQSSLGPGSGQGVLVE